MDKTEFNVRQILAGQAPHDAAVTVKGWVRTRRDSKAGISFVHLSDGSSFHPVQVVAPNTLPNYADEVLKLTAGCAVEATGTIVPSPAKGQLGGAERPRTTCPIVTSALADAAAIAMTASTAANAAPSFSLIFAMRRSSLGGAAVGSHQTYTIVHRMRPQRVEITRIRPARSAAAEGCG